jgi:hypothetical protein
MVKVFLDVNDNFIINDSNVTVKGLSGGSEKVTISAGVTGVTTDANLEAIDFAGALSSYQFKVTSGQGIQIFDGAGVLLTTIPSINADAMKIAFADGTANLVQTGGTAFSLGGQSISTITTAAISATSMGTLFNTAITSITNASGISLTPAPTTSTINVTTAGTYILTSAADTVNISAGSYDATIQGFAVGDKIDLPTSFLSTLTLSNANSSDGSLVLQGNDETNNVITITLTGITAAIDASIYSLASFQTIFGAGSLF